MSEVHPEWNRDMDGETWANVRIYRILERSGPLEVLTLPVQHLLN